MNSKDLLPPTSSNHYIKKDREFHGLFSCPQRQAVTYNGVGMQPAIVID
jgi:hypothetical protein